MKDRYKYQLVIERNSQVGYWPITVSLSKGQGIIEEWSGNRLKPLLSKASKFILEDHDPSQS